MRRARDSRALILKKLALRVVRRRDREAALVLGDAMMEQGLERVQTGRVRPVRFIIRRLNAEALGITSVVQLAGTLGTGYVYQPSYETLYNVDRFARLQTEEAWGAIFSMWITPKRGTYQALVRAGILPRSFQFHEIQWVPTMLEELGYLLYLARIPKRRKKSVRTFLLEILRSDMPATREEHFDEPTQRSLFEDDR